MDEYFDRFCFTAVSERPENWEELIKYAHSFGHFQTAVTTARLRNLCRWHNMEQDVRQVISKCHVCAKGNYARNIRAPLSVQGDEFSVMESIAIDHVKGLVPSADGMHFILSVKDVFSGYVMFIPVPTDQAVDTVRALWIHRFCRFGFPKHIKSDRGPGFVAKLTNGFNVLLGIHHRFSAPHVPRSHGNIEVSHKGLNSQLRKLTNHENWSLQIPLIGYSMNTSLSKSRGFTPCEIVFGRNFTSDKLGRLAVEDRWQFLSQVVVPLVKANRAQAKKQMK